MALIDNLDTIDQENEDDISVKLSDLQQAVIWGTDWTTGTIVTQMEKGLIDLKPKFQRREAWDDKRKSKFIESVILGLPIPQIILAERKEKKGTYIVIDGKQRLISLRRFFAHKDALDFQPLKLKGLDSLNMLNRYSFTDLQENPELSDFTYQIENQTIRTIVIRYWPNEEFLYNVFLRLNTGSLQLSPQELRQALHPGKFIDFTDEFSIQSAQIKRILNITKPDYRMRDIELVIRFYSFKFFINDYTGNLKQFFDTTVEYLNAHWDEEENIYIELASQLEEAIEFTYSIFGNDAFKKWKNNTFDSRFNRAIYDIMVYYFSNGDLRNSINAKIKNQLKSKFKELCEKDTEFLASFESSTKNMAPTKKRFKTWGKAIMDICHFPIDLPNL